MQLLDERSQLSLTRFSLWPLPASVDSWTPLLRGEGLTGNAAVFGGTRDCVCTSLSGRLQCRMFPGPGGGPLPQPGLDNPYLRASSL